MNKFQDIELLSSYLDGQLSPSDSARLESRLQSDPELASALDDLRSARSILRKLPARKAPRNFILTRKMVGIKPPMPQSYSFFRFSSAFATALLILTFAFNTFSRGIVFGAAATGAPAYGYGGGGSGADVTESQAFAAATQAPAATEPPAVVQAPAAAEIAPSSTELPPSVADNSARESETPTTIEGVNPKQAPTEQPVPVQFNNHNEPFQLLSTWQWILLIIGLLSALIAFFINQSVKRKWK